MSIVIKSVSKIYGQQLALDSVSFEINPGEIVGFIGPNGAGKSTMMKIITGYLPQTSGTVLVNEVDTLDDTLNTRRNIGYLPELNPLYLNMYVTEYLLFVAGIYKLGRNLSKRVDEIIALTGLSVEKNKKIGALSKGYKQRVGLAQALIHDPKVLILDEPTSGLDPNQLVEIRNLIKDTGQNKSVLLSTHIMQEVEAICQKIIVINKGKIVADGAANNINKDNETVVVEFSSKIEKDFFVEIPGTGQLFEKDGNIWLIENIGASDLRELIFKKAVEKGKTVLSMQRKGKSLEEVFRELTR
jgi:ABC-2 type transport system ATP-binding protein